MTTWSLLLTFQKKTESDFLDLNLDSDNCISLDKLLSQKFSSEILL